MGTTASLGLSELRLDEFSAHELREHVEMLECSELCRWLHLHRCPTLRVKRRQLTGAALLRLTDEELAVLSLSDDAVRNLGPCWAAVREEEAAAQAEVERQAAEALAAERAADEAFFGGGGDDTTASCSAETEGTPLAAPPSDALSVVTDPEEEDTGLEARDGKGTSTPHDEEEEREEEEVESDHGHEAETPGDSSVERATASPTSPCGAHSQRKTTKKRLKEARAWEEPEVGPETPVDQLALRARRDRRRALHARSKLTAAAHAQELIFERLMLNNYRREPVDPNDPNAPDHWIGEAQKRQLQQLQQQARAEWLADLDEVQLCMSRTSYRDGKEGLRVRATQVEEVKALDGEALVPATLRLAQRNSTHWSDSDSEEERPPFPLDRRAWMPKGLEDETKEYLSLVHPIAKKKGRPPRMRVLRGGTGDDASGLQSWLQRESAARDPMQLPVGGDVDDQPAASNDRKAGNSRGGSSSASQGDEGASVSASGGTSVRTSTVGSVSGASQEASGGEGPQSIVVDNLPTSPRFVLPTLYLHQPLLARELKAEAKANAAKAAARARAEAEREAIEAAEREAERKARRNSSSFRDRSKRARSRRSVSSRR